MGIQTRYLYNVFFILAPPLLVFFVAFFKVCAPPAPALPLHWCGRAPPAAAGVYHVCFQYYGRWWPQLYAPLTVSAPFYLTRPSDGILGRDSLIIIGVPPKGLSDSGWAGSGCWTPPGGG